MAPSSDKLSKITPCRECIRIMVRIARMWTVPAFNNPGQPGSLEMVLVDEHV